ncbi:MAG: phytanoyl-CoA dioxygenase family protein [Candidatus Latescibacteria bacterium]|nr:phytanoyl-CoA dioxygenase family protein [Candidatus Latescibacterota bacterium]
MKGVEHTLDQLEKDGFVLIEHALSPDETEHIRQRINHAREMGWEEGLNAVGNMWFDTLLDREPENFAPLVGHSSVRPYLEGMMGKQCQLRSLRAHINPGAYLQEWHMDFYGYWQERREVKKYRLAVPPAGVNTTFYFQDNGPGLGHLTFIKNGHLVEPPHLYPIDRPKFEAWCEQQEHVVLYPKAGDCVVFLSHIPHQGAKERDDMERSNVVCHYQVTPMYEGIWFVSRARGYAGTFPFAQ